MKSASVAARQTTARLAWATSIAAAVLLALPTAQAAPVTGQSTLQARDLDGNGQTDAFYDTVLNITWLRNANANGPMNWNQANTWANNLTFGGYTDWRLPTMVDTGLPGAVFSETNPGTYAGGTDYSYNVQTTSTVGNVTTVYSEMASLYYDTQSNKAYCTPGIAICTEQAGWGLINTGDFIDLQPYYYWSGLGYAPDPADAWGFDFTLGGQDFYFKDNEFFAMAVRPGDVTATSVPEPGTLVLAVAALVGLGMVRKQRGALAFEAMLIKRL